MWEWNQMKFQMADQKQIFFFFFIFSRRLEIKKGKIVLFKKHYSNSQPMAVALETVPFINSIHCFEKLQAYSALIEIKMSERKRVEFFYIFYGFYIKKKRKEGY